MFIWLTAYGPLATMDLYNLPDIVADIRYCNRNVGVFLKFMKKVDKNG